MTSVEAPLLMLLGGGAFVAGFLTAVEVVAVVMRRRVDRLVRERRALNAVWRRLREQFGIVRLPWLQDFLDRPEVFGDRSHTGSAGVYACSRCHSSDCSRSTCGHRP
jgi:hypothetical protein